MNEKQLEKINRYEIRDIIGRGSMGVVYLAYDPVLEREVAIKTIETGLEDKESEFEVFIERFKREAKAAAKLSHQGIITIFDFGFIDEKKPFIVMEYIKGKSLKKYFEENIRFELSVIKNIVIQISKALDYAHKAGIVHRDIKPANIIIQDDFTIKIADFGIAKLPQSELTKTGEIIGTPSYMSPEQITGIPADYRADLFSLGVILYQFLTGERPFLGESFGSLSYRIVHEQPLAPKVINPSIPDVYSNITMALLEKDRNKRPSLEKVISEFVLEHSVKTITERINLSRYKILKILWILRKIMAGTKIQENFSLTTKPIIGIAYQDGKFFAEVISDAKMIKNLKPLASKQQFSISENLEKYIALVFRGNLYRLFPKSNRQIDDLERFWGYLKRKLSSKGGVRKEKLSLYLAEYSWRYNHRKLNLKEQEKILLNLIFQYFRSKN